MIQRLWLPATFALLGAGAWLAEYRLQKDRARRWLVVRPPRWLVWFCGDPCRDGTLDLPCALRQGAALVFLLGAPLVALLGLEAELQGALLFLGYALLALAALAAGEWARRRGGPAPRQAPLRRSGHRPGLHRTT